METRPKIARVKVGTFPGANEGLRWRRDGDNPATDSFQYVRNVKAYVAQLERKGWRVRMLEPPQREIWLCGKHRYEIMVVAEAEKEI